MPRFVVLLLFALFSLACAGPRDEDVAASASTALSPAGTNAASTAPGKTGVCHRTGSRSHPFNYIEVDAHAVPAHRAHGDAIAPDFASDVANCGGCGIACDDGDPCAASTCVDGACVRAPVSCSHLDTACTVGVCDARTGACGTAPRNENACCTTAGGLSGRCAAGQCAVPPGFASDPANCGGCGISCDDGNPCTVDSCAAGACAHAAMDCSQLDSDCTAGVCVNGSCTAVNRNEDHCCGTAGSGKRCKAGVCTQFVCGPASQNVGGVCVPLPDDCIVDNCRCGFENVGGICVPLPTCF